MTANLTTVNIKKEYQKELKKLSQSWGMSQVEFINNAIWYFKKTGVNPKSPIFSPKEELAKLEARLNQVIKFIRQQEKEKLNPLLDQLIITERRLKESLALGVDKSDFDSLISKVEGFSTRIDLLSYDQEEHKRHLSREISNFERKIEGNVKRVNNDVIVLKDAISCLFDALNNRGLTGKFNQTDITSFNNAIHKV